uniref:GST C-terminal domain-containing protein n=1 Tax=Leptobrachium leishanense TaxID=445787 RepID=A0A8C5R9P6_9ANUR
MKTWLTWLPILECSDSAHFLCQPSMLAAALRVGSPSLRGQDILPAALVLLPGIAQWHLPALFKHRPPCLQSCTFRDPTSFLYQSLRHPAAAWGNVGAVFCCRQVRPLSLKSQVAPGSLQGDGLRQKTLIQLWLRFAEREIVPLLYICVYPLLGILPVLAQPMERAMGAFKKVMSVLETQLRTRTYMVGERLSLADITLVSALVMPYLLVFDPTFRQPYGSVSRWFMMCVNIPAFAEVLGHVTLCEEPMRYGEGNVVSITFPIRRPEEAAEDAEVEVEEAAEVEVEAAEVEVVEEQAAAGEEPAHGNNSDHEE